MTRRQQRSCPRCAAVWHQRDARFCGRCGQPLPVAAHRTQPAWQRRSLAPIATGLVVVAIVLVGGGVATDGLDRSDAVEPLVGAPRSVPPLAAEDTAAVGRHVDPHRLRCAPRGCERWWRPRRGDDDPLGAAEVAGVAMLRSGDRLIAFDPASGLLRWWAPLEGPPTDPYGQLRWRGGWRLLNRGPDDTVIAVSDAGLTAFHSDGVEAWSLTPARTTIRDVRVVDDTVLVHAEKDTASPRAVLMGVDATAGTTRWTVDVRAVRLLGDDVVVVSPRPRILRGLDPMTGETLWDRVVLGDVPVETAGPWLALTNGSGTTLIDPRTGEDLDRQLDGWLVQPPAAAGDRWLLVVRSTATWPTEPPQLRLVAVDGDAAHAWELDLAATPGSGCCPVLASDDGTATVIDDLHEYVVELTTGRTLAERRRAGEVDHLGGWHADVGIYVQWRPDGVTLRTSAGTFEVSQPGGAWVESLDPLVVGSRDQLLGIGGHDGG